MWQGRVAVVIATAATAVSDHNSQVRVNNSPSCCCRCSQANRSLPPSYGVSVSLAHDAPGGGVKQCCIATTPCDATSLHENHNTQQRLSCCMERQRDAVTYWPLSWMGQSYSEVLISCDVLLIVLTEGLYCTVPPTVVLLLWNARSLYISSVQYIERRKRRLRRHPPAPSFWLGVLGNKRVMTIILTLARSVYTGWK